ncbi:MAG: hypothetical protein E4G90_09475 [Gemmatimonadales bacterium]|nr:MAG: hypothetical protein E4G90_09475 [Gemmatimonadales bacterium]
MDPPAPDRNAPCPCGSGVKYKKCHLASDEAGTPCWSEFWEDENAENKGEN